MICCLLRYVPFFHMFVLFHCSFGHCFLLSFPTRRSSDLVHFDRWFSELSLYEDKKVIAALSKLQEKGNTYEKDGATWFKSTQFEDRKSTRLNSSHVSISYAVFCLKKKKNKKNNKYIVSEV